MFGMSIEQVMSRELLQHVCSREKEQRAGAIGSLYLPSHCGHVLRGYRKLHRCSTHLLLFTFKCGDVVRMFPNVASTLIQSWCQDSVNRVTEQKYCIIGQQPSSAFDFSDSPGGTLEIEHILLYCGSE